MQRFTITRTRSSAPRPKTRQPGDHELRLDAQTFRDLEIFEAQEGRPGIFRLLDRARTRGGAAVLHDRFLAPSSEAERIRATQASVRFIAGHRDAFGALPGQYVVSAFENYFHWQGVPPVSFHPVAAAVDAAQLLFESYRNYAKIAIGVRQTARMLRALRQVALDPALADAPGELGGLLGEMRALLTRPGLAALRLEREERWRVARILVTDRVLRGSEKEAMERLAALVFEIDALVSMADAGRDFGFTFPEILDGPPQVVAEGVFHPVVEGAVPNPLRLDQQSRLLFLTGPNMAGKTTYLRACGIAVYLAHLGMGVPAASMRFAPCEAFFTSISLSDNVRAGISFFEAEALRARAIAAAVADGLRVVALLDEPFKGTNVKDALDASCAFLSRLARREGCLFLVSSHLIEAAEPLRATGHIDCRRFEAAEQGGRLAFDYVLRPGVSSQRLGMRVLQEKGVFALLDRDGAEAPGEEAV